VPKTEAAGHASGREGVIGGCAVGVIPITEKLARELFGDRIPGGES
jgi:hypothetical protein